MFIDLPVDIGLGPSFILGVVFAHIVWGVILYAKMHSKWRADEDGQVYLPGRFVSKTSGETFTTTVEAYNHAKQEQNYSGPIYPAEWAAGFELVSELELERHDGHRRDGIQ